MLYRSTFILYSLILFEIVDNQIFENQIRCDLEKKQLCDVRTCSCYKFPNGTVKIDVSCFLAEPVPKATLQIEFFYKRNDRFLRALPTVQANLCDLLAGSKANVIMRKLFTIARGHVNVSSCPLQGLMEVKDGLSLTNSMPPILPAGMIKVLAKLFEPQSKRTLILVEYHKIVLQKWNN